MRKRLGLALLMIPLALTPVVVNTLPTKYVPDWAAPDNVWKLPRPFASAVVAADPTQPAPTPTPPAPTPPKPREVPVLVMPDKVAADAGVFVIVTPTKFIGDAIQWVSIDTGLSVLPPDLLARRDVLVVMSGRAGVYRVLAVAAGTGADGKAVLSPIAICTITVGTPPPDPGPNPPGPNPPGPTPGPAPIPDAGFRVMIIEETLQRGKLTPGQYSAILGADVRAYLIAKCVGGREGFRIWDKDVTGVEAESTIWQNAFKLPRTQTPWLIVSSGGKGGYSGPLPEKLEDTMKILKQWGE